MENLANALPPIAHAFEQQYPSVNIFLERDGHFPGTDCFLRQENDSGSAYQQQGRYETEDEARHMDRVIMGMLHEHRLDFMLCKRTDIDGVTDYVTGRLQSPARTT